MSDPLGLTAQGLPTLRRRNKRQDLNFLKSLARQHKVSLIVLGNPVHMNGTEGVQSAKARAFAAELRKHLNIPVQLRDERLTSVEARRLLQEFQPNRERKAGEIDRAAAVLLLQEFLDSQRVALGTKPQP